MFKIFTCIYKIVVRVASKVDHRYPLNLNKSLIAAIPDPGSPPHNVIEREISYVIPAPT